jgi:hypothetical protein
VRGRAKLDERLGDGPAWIYIETGDGRVSAFRDSMGSATRAGRPRLALGQVARTSLAIELEHVGITHTVDDIA